MERRTGARRLGLAARTVCTPQQWLRTPQQRSLVGESRTTSAPQDSGACRSNEPLRDASHPLCSFPNIQHPPAACDFGDVSIHLPTQVGGRGAGSPVRLPMRLALFCMLRHLRWLAPQKSGHSGPSRPSPTLTHKRDSSLSSLLPCNCIALALSLSFVSP